MLRITLRGADVPTVVLGSGETLVIGRAPQTVLPPDAQLRYTMLSLPRCAPHVSRLLGELVVGQEMVRLRWRGGIEAQLSSLFDAPGGARRVTLTDGMAALLDEGENQLLVLRGRQLAQDTLADLSLIIDVSSVDAAAELAPQRADPAHDTSPTGEKPSLRPGEREWFVALALAEPWLNGTDDYPRPPTNREVYERILRWRGHSWNLDRPQRVDDAIRAIASVAFGPRDNPFHVQPGQRVQNVRFAVGRRAAEVRLVTAEDLSRVERASTNRNCGGS